MKIFLKSNISLIADKTFLAIALLLHTTTTNVTFCMAKGPKQGTKKFTNIQHHPEIFCVQSYVEVFFLFFNPFSSQAMEK